MSMLRGQWRQQYFWMGFIYPHHRTKPKRAQPLMPTLGHNQVVVSAEATKLLSCPLASGVSLGETRPDNFH